ncbi:MAG: hypothetical protein R2911_27895 [Caldilineaceae bacterium]
MIQTKFTLYDNQVDFLTQFRTYGFKDKSDMVRHALDALQHAFEQQQLRESAKLYAELYDEDAESREWIEAAAQQWPA